MTDPGALRDAFWTVVERVRSAITPTHGTTPSPVSPSADIRIALDRLDAIRDECRRLVTRRASLSAGVAVVPLPGLDLGTDLAILVKMLPQINERFGLDPAQIERLDADTKRVVLVMIGGVGSTLVGRLVTRELVMKILMKMGVRVTTKGVVKFVPLLGQAISASISFGAMRMLGNRHVDDCYRVARETLLQKAGPTAGTWEIVP